MCGQMCSLATCSLPAWAWPIWLLEIWTSLAALAAWILYKWVLSSVSLIHDCASFSSATQTSHSACATSMIQLALARSPFGGNAIYKWGRHSLCNVFKIKATWCLRIETYWAEYISYCHISPRSLWKWEQCLDCIINSFLWRAVQAQILIGDVFDFVVCRFQSRHYWGWR